MSGKKGTLKIKRRGGGSSPARGKAAGNPSFGTEQKRSGSGVSSPASAPGSPRNPERRKPAEPFDIARLSQQQYEPSNVPLPEELEEAPQHILSRWRADLEIFRTLPGGEEVAFHGALRNWLKSAGREVARMNWEELRAGFKVWRG